MEGAGHTISKASMGDLEPTITRPGGWVLRGVVDLFHVCHERTLVAPIDPHVAGRLIGACAAEGVDPLARYRRTSLDGDFLVGRPEATINIRAVACHRVGRNIGDGL